MSRGVRTSTGTPITLRFPGQWFQAESGLHQNWMRDYDPTTGRYLQADPLGLVDGASVYGYAGQNPGRYIDPTGEFKGVPDLVIPDKVAVATGVRGALGPIGLGVAIGLGIGPTGDGTLQPGVVEAQQKEDCCQIIYQKIADAVSEMMRRYNEQSRNTYDRPFGHARQIIEKQRYLRKLIDEAKAAKCLNFDPRAYYYAWSPVPGPGYTFPPHF